MKRRTPSLLTGLLLTCFLVGGVAAPSLHRVQHAQERAVARAEARVCQSHAHQGPAAERAHAWKMQQFCFICVRLPYRPAFPSAVAVVAPQPELLLRAGEPTFTAIPSFRRSVIRGPPARV